MSQKFTVMTPDVASTLNLAKQRILGQQENRGEVIGKGHTRFTLFLDDDELFAFCGRLKKQIDFFALN